MRSNNSKLNTSTSTLLGIAGNAPAYTIAITCWTLIVAAGTFSAAILFWCGLLVIGVGYSYGRLNKLEVSNGAAFTWVSKLIHPRAGFMAGWCLLAASILFLISATIPASKLLLFFLNITETKFTILFCSIVLILILAFFSCNGIVFVGKKQAFLTLIEILVLLVVIFAVINLWQPNLSLNIRPQILSLYSISIEQLSQGIVIAIFFFWGWDVLFNASEVTINSSTTSNNAGYLTIIILIFIFTIFTIISQQNLNEQLIKNADGNLLIALTNLIESKYLLSAVRIAFFVSTIGAIFACFIQFSQTLHAQSKVGYFTAALAATKSSTQAPVTAIITQSFLAILILILSSYSATVDEILTSTIAASAVFVAFYYGFTTMACISNEFRQNATVFEKIARSLLPLAGLIALWVAATLVAITFSKLSTAVISILFIIGFLLSLQNRKNSA